MWPILVCSVASLALVVSKSCQLSSALRRLGASPDSAADAEDSPIAPIWDAVQSGLDEKQLSFIGTKQVRNLEKGLGVLSLIAVVSPLLGFTGTVTGMIQAFMVIAGTSGGTRVEPSMVAGGIYEALITTAFGLFVAIPTHIAVHFLEDRLDGIAMRMEEIAMALVARRNNDFRP